MTIGTEELIVQAVERLLMQKKVKKLTVKDIVEECGITRQTFYYHFRDIPDLLKGFGAKYRSAAEGNACPGECGKGPALPVFAGAEYPTLM